MLKIGVIRVRNLLFIRIEKTINTIIILDGYPQIFQNTKNEHIINFQGETWSIRKKLATFLKNWCCFENFRIKIELIAKKLSLLAEQR